MPPNRGRTSPTVDHEYIGHRTVSSELGTPLQVSPRSNLLRLENLLSGRRQRFPHRCPSDSDTDVCFGILYETSDTSADITSNQIDRRTFGPLLHVRGCDSPSLAGATRPWERSRKFQLLFPAPPQRIYFLQRTCTNFRRRRFDVRRQQRRVE